ncbi:gluconokinase [Corynebacterium breve]|uniref:Gluconokinase n=1 Tax=Corynebacterium breve TaxID=3049799 RepID=A0ABY8VG56_9CORY|nr:gluconokinase [Corynebacterium breve]WIM67628.1 gluconokinase [Corynebacterium breve]
MTDDKPKKIPTMSIHLGESSGPYVLALDVGSTASRGGLYDVTGCPVKGSKQRISHEFTTAQDGTSEIDPDQVAEECREIVSAIVDFAAENALQIKGVCFDSFASSFLLVDDSGAALTSCATYADSRCAPYVAEVESLIDPDAYHQRTGVRVHTSYQPARFLWAQSDFPEKWDAAAKVMTIGEYVYLKLADIEGLAVSTGAWCGIVNAHTGELDGEVLEACNVPESMIAPLHFPDEPAYPAQTEWEALNGVPWFHGIPDGWPSNVGPGAIDPTTIAVAAATSGAMRVILPEAPETIPSGLWCYRVARDQVILGGALNDVGRAVSWLERVVTPVDSGELAEVLAGATSEHAPVVLPFFSGERATGWAADAKASLVGITDDTTPLDLWRGLIEGLAVSYERVYEQLDLAGAQPERIIASGRVTTDHPQWLNVLADALGCEVIPLAMKRATLRGTALITLDVIAPGIQRATPPFGEPMTPNPAHADYFDRLRTRFDELYSELVAAN